LPLVFAISVTFTLVFYWPLTITPTFDKEPKRQEPLFHLKKHESDHRWPLPCLVRETGLEPLEKEVIKPYGASFREGRGTFRGTYILCAYPANKGFREKALNYCINHDTT
jgi:hypothetical protein